MRRIGVDIGGVLIGGDAQGQDTMFSPHDYLRTPEVPGAMDALAHLSTSWEVWLVSKCGSRVEGRTREWLSHHDLTGRTGVPPERWRFCKTRPEKGPIATELGLRVFVDDRLDVLETMPPEVAKLVWFGPKADPDQVGRTRIKVCPDWKTALTIIW